MQSQTETVSSFDDDVDDADDTDADEEEEVLLAAVMSIFFKCDWCLESFC